MTVRRWLAVLMCAPMLLTAQTPVSRTFAVSPEVSMRIWVPAGKVRVETWDRDSIAVVGTVAAGAHFYGGGSGVGAKLGIDLDDPKDTRLANADLVVTVPRKAHVWVKMTDGSVTASNTMGELDVITVTGTVTVQDARGVVSVETIDATARLTGIAGDLRVRSGGGRIVLREIFATMSVATVAGNVDITTSGMHDGRIETIGGFITVRGTVAHDALLELETHSGQISLIVEPTLIPSLALLTRNGFVRNTMGLGNAKFGKIDAHSFKGDINVLPMTKGN